MKAAVAMAPLAPGFRTPLFMRAANLIPIWQGRPLNPPTRRRLFEFVADADVHSRAQIIKTLTPGATAAALEVVKGDIAFATAKKTAPRLIVAGESDIFAPYEKLEQFAHRIGAPIVKIPGRGHWLIGGRGTGARHQRDSALPGQIARARFTAALSRGMEERGVARLAAPSGSAPRTSNGFRIAAAQS